MQKKFKVEFLSDAIKFMESPDEKTREKIYFELKGNKDGKQTHKKEES